MPMRNPLEDIVPFVLTADAKSFGAAARQLGVNPSSISRAVAHLESELGVPLLRRTSRSVSLTPEGQRFFAQCREILDKIDIARKTVTSSRNSVSGTFKVSMPVALGTALIVPALTKFQERHPDLRICASLVDRSVDLAQEDFDAAVRIGPLRDSALFARRVGASRFVVVAAPTYLEQAGIPMSLDDLREHRCIAFRMANGSERPWRFDVSDGGRHTVQVRPRTILDNGSAIAAAVVAGAGIAYLPDYLVRQSLQNGAVVQLLGGQGECAGEIFILRSGGPKASANCAAFTEFLIDALS